MYPECSSKQYDAEVKFNMAKEIVECNNIPCVLSLLHLGKIIIFSKAFQSSSQCVLTFFIDKVAGKFGRDFIYKKKKQGRVNGAERQTEYT